ncbi:MAG: hypothetical protein CME65_03795 [Halobacteriovoraceae bacterium]|nr:hypothetical protein [Halobacteriovoraceae bacterium]
MMIFIPQRHLSFIFFLVLTLGVTACKTEGTESSSSHLKSYPTKTLVLGDQKVKVFIANTDARQRKGLSTIKSEDFPGDWGMLFPEESMRLRQFWMPETYFDLDVIFMNDDYYVLDIHRKLKHYPKKGGRRGVDVPLSKEVFSQHILEVRSDSPISAKIKPGITLKFID